MQIFVFIFVFEYQCKGMQRGLFQCWRDTPEPIHTLPHFGSTEGGDDADGDDGKKEMMLVMLASKYRPFQCMLYL